MASASPPAPLYARTARPDGDNKHQYFNRLAVQFSGLLHRPQGPLVSKANGPVDGSSDRAGSGHFEASAGALGRRGSSGEAALLGDLLDPLCRSLATAPVLPLLAPAGSSPSAPEGFPLRAPLADLATVEEVVRRVAWGGDRRSGVARIELGGAHLGTAIVVRGAGREVSLSIEVGRGSDMGELPARLVERLQARGLEVTELEVL